MKGLSQIIPGQQLINYFDIFDKVFGKKLKSCIEQEVQLQDKKDKGLTLEQTFSNSKNRILEIQQQI
jgi:hypothetical protein